MASGLNLMKKPFYHLVPIFDAMANNELPNLIVIRKVANNTSNEQTFTNINKC